MNRNKTKRFATVMRVVYLIILMALLFIAVKILYVELSKLPEAEAQGYDAGYAAGHMLGVQDGATIENRNIKDNIAITSVASSFVELTFPDGNSELYEYSYVNNSEYPEGFGKPKTYESYKLITSPTAKQTKLNNLPEVYTDQYGFRKINDYYLVALGSFYGDIGDIFLVSLSEGRMFIAIKGDTKADEHTDALHQQHLIDGSVIEFIVDSDKLVANGCKGDCSIFNFEGSITDIQLIGHYDF